MDWKTTLRKRWWIVLLLGYGILLNVLFVVLVHGIRSSDRAKPSALTTDTAGAVRGIESGASSELRKQELSAFKDSVRTCYRILTTEMRALIEIGQRGEVTRAIRAAGIVSEKVRREA